METFSALLAFCAGIHRSPMNSSHKGHWVTWSFDLRLKQQLSKQWVRRWFEVPSCSLWRHCNAHTPESNEIILSPFQLNSSTHPTSWVWAPPYQPVFSSSVMVSVPHRLQLWSSLRYLHSSSTAPLYIAPSTPPTWVYRLSTSLYQVNGPIAMPNR